MSQKNSHYSNWNNRIDTLVGDQDKYQYWNRLTQAHRDYDQVTTTMTFIEWTADTWGLQIQLDNENRYTAEYTVLDEEKFLLFQLKYV